MHERLLYQDTRGNAVFPCKDRQGMARGAALRGTDACRPFKAMAAGSDHSYGWHSPAREDGSPVIVTESPIDALSLVVLAPDLSRQHLLSLNGVGGRPLGTFLKEYPEVREVVLALDNDVAGREATKRLQAELVGRGYGVRERRPEAEYKDWNQELVAATRGR
jgi:hypothetical protein